MISGMGKGMPSRETRLFFEAKCPGQLSGYGPKSQLAHGYRSWDCFKYARSLHYLGYAVKHNALG